MNYSKIHAYVVIEVKIGEFNPSDFEQLVFYVNAIDRLEKTDRDDPTIVYYYVKKQISLLLKQHFQIHLHI